MTEPEFDARVASDRKAISCEVLFCLSFGIFLAAEGWPAAVALACFGFFFSQYLGRLIDLERGEQ